MAPSEKEAYDSIVLVELRVIQKQLAVLVHLPERVDNLRNMLERHISWCREDMGKAWDQIHGVEKACSVSQEIRAMADRRAAVLPHWAKVAWTIGAALIGAGILWAARHGG